MVLDLDLGVTRSALDALSVRTKAVLHNLANQSTPGYKKFRVRFEDLMRDAHSRGQSTKDIKAQIVRDDSGPPGVNNVSVMEELSILAKVQLAHDVFSRRAAGYFNHLNKAIRGQ